MSSPIDHAIHQLSRMPSIGEKTATRLIYWLLSQDPEVSMEIGRAICGYQQNFKNVISAFPYVKRIYVQSVRTSNEQIKSSVSLKPPKTLEPLNPQENLKEGTMYWMDSFHHKKVLFSALTNPRTLERLRSGEVEEVFVATNPTLEGDLTNHLSLSCFEGSGHTTNPSGRRCPCWF